MEANFAHYALQKLHILPSQFVNMEENEKAFLIASCMCRIEEEKAQAKKLKQKKR